MLHVSIEILLLLQSIHTGASIKCFNCNSNIDIRCALAYPPSEFIVDCEQLSHQTNLTYTYCRKISQIIKFGINECKYFSVLWIYNQVSTDISINSPFFLSHTHQAVNPDSRVVRECGSNITDVRTVCFERHGISSIQSICECDISYCNSAKRVMQTANVLVAAIIAASSLKFYELFRMI